MAFTVLHIGGRGADPGNSGDQPIIDRLKTTLGHTMTYLDGDGNPPGSVVTTAAAVAAAATGAGLVVLTSSVRPSSISGDIFAGLTVPVMSAEGWTWDNDRFVEAGKGGETSKTYTAITIVAPSHPCAGGLSGDVTLLSGKKKLNYAVAASLPAGVTPVATVKGDATKVVLWAAESGGLLADGVAAAGRRGGFPTIYDASAGLTGDGWTLFDAMVDWVANPTAAITPSATHVGTDSHSGAGQAVDASAVVPEVMLEVAWGVDWDTEPTSAQWIDESAKVRDPQMIRWSTGGRSADLGRTEPGWMQFAFDNRERNVEPGYQVNVRPRTHVRLLVRWYGVWHRMWRGFATSWQPLYPGGGWDAIVMVDCVDLHAVAANTEIDGGHINTYIEDSPGGLHLPMDEQTGNYAREIITPVANGMWVGGVTLNDDTFAVDRVSKAQYPLKDTAAQAYEPLFNLANTGPMSIGFWMRDNGTIADPWNMAEARNTDFLAWFYSWRMQLDGGIDVTWHDDGASVYTTVVASSDAMDGAWHYLMLVRDGAGTSWTVQAFLDGQPLADPVAGPVETPGGVSPHEVAAFGWNFLGWMGQISIFSEALSDAAVGEIYDSFLDILPQQSSSDRIDTILRSYLNLDPGLINLDTGLSAMPTRNLHRKSVAEALDKAAEAELGLFLMDGSGRATLHNRTRRHAGLPVLEVGVGSVIPIDDVAYRSSEDVVINTVVVDRAEGTDSASAVDRSCVDRDGERRLPVSLDVTSQPLARSYAAHLLATRKDAGLRVDQVRFNPRKDAGNMFGPLLGARVSDRVRVRHDPIDDADAIPGLYALWRLDETTGYPQDTSGNARHWLSGTSGTSEPGIVDGAIMKPDGGTFSVHSTNSYEMLPTAQDFTVACWVRIRDWTGGASNNGDPIMLRHEIWPTAGFRFYMDFGAGSSSTEFASLRLLSAHSTGQSIVAYDLANEGIYRSNFETDSGWFHAAAAYRHSDGFAKIWYNGQVGTDWTSIGVMTAANTWQYMFGGWINTSATWKQTLDHVVVSDQILSDTDIAKLANPNIDYYGYTEKIDWEIDTYDWRTTHRISPENLSHTTF